MSAPASEPSHPQPTALQFNKELLFGEVGSLLAAYIAGFTVARFTHRSTLISASLVVATLLGGTLFWLTARILHGLGRRGWSARVLARDISFFTPAAIVLGFVVYDPAIFLVSRLLLDHRSGVGPAVAAGQITAFALFLASMNAYRLALMKARGPRL